uniref:Uncharacterized protein n=1 Tax=Romanomermis culicivorax TaxID=13658 RepID=A0A915IDJ6_ROMCU
MVEEQGLGEYAINKDEASFLEFLEEVGNGTNFIEKWTLMSLPWEMWGVKYNKRKEKYFALENKTSSL